MSRRHASSPPARAERPCRIGAGTGRRQWPRFVALLALLAPCIATADGSGCDLDAADARAAGAGCATAWIDRHLHLNDVLAIGTHNSYKQALPPDELAAHRARDKAGADGIDYAHRPLPEQLDRGARQLELDVWYDPDGGRYAHPPGAQRKGYAAPPWPPAQAAAMAKPGFKVMHLADIDFRSHCMAFVECLGQIRAWSSAHPRHVPILILINAKDGRLGPGARPALPFDAQAFDRLDAEIRAVFAPHELVTPDQVQGDHATLREAVLAGGWPTLGEARGRVLFALDEEAAKVALYRGGRHSLEGRAMFANADEASPAAAYLTLNEPQTDAVRIAAAVRAGFLVRTRADADTREARRNDTRRREAALSGGAQYVSTDYPDADTRFGAYRVSFEDGAVARCNPLRAATKCAGLPIE